MTFSIASGNVLTHGKALKKDLKCNKRSIFLENISVGMDFVIEVGILYFVKVDDKEKVRIFKWFSHSKYDLVRFNFLNLFYGIVLPEVEGLNTKLYWFNKHIKINNQPSI